MTKQAKAPIHARPPRAADKPQVVAEPKRVAPLKAMQLSDVITVVTPNPYRHGNKSWVSFNKYKNGMTVEEALKLGIPRDWLAWDRRYKYISVEPAA